MKIALTSFSGRIPHINERLLPDNAATVAMNARLERGDLAPMRGGVLLETYAGAADNAIYFYGGYTPFAADGNAVHLDGTSTLLERLITTDGVKPQIVLPTNPMDLALPKPAASPTISLIGTVDPELREDVIYAYTFVSNLGEESQPSPLTPPFAWSPGVVVTLSGFSAPVAGRLVQKRRIYRSQTSASGATALYFVAEISTAISTYDHDLDAEPFQEIIPSIDYDPPPDKMNGIVEMANGMYAAFEGNTVLFCEPYQPHAWPQKYSLYCSSKIVAIISFGSSLAILTDGAPYIAQGTTPESMNMERSEENLPCLAKRGAIDIGYGAIYPSRDGLVLITQSGAQVITKNLFTYDQWQAMNPETFIAARKEDRYCFSYDNGNRRYLGFVDITGQVPFYLESDEEARSVFYDYKTGQMCYIASNGKSVYTFDDHTGVLKDTYTWKSKEFHFPIPVNFGCILVQGKAIKTINQCNVSVYFDGVLYTILDCLNEISRLPPGLHQTWQIEISSNSEISSVILAGSPEEIFS